MIDAQNQPSHGMTVDIRLCGNLTRKEINDQLCRYRGAPCALSVLSAHGRTLSASCLAGTNASSDGFPTLPKTGARDGLSCLILRNKNINSSSICEKMLNNDTTEKTQPFAPILEPPSWAEPAKGEARLEPVCESLGRQSAVDLTTKSSFRVGRSPNSDIQLMHATSSRKHAILFHHSNGSCYIVDCGSAHGTFVNGKRVTPPPEGGVIVPQKVRRGSIIRFGGPGAPSFVLKSFSFKLDDIEECPTDTKDMGVLVRRNTRLNALGTTAAERVRSNLSSTINNALDVMRKRSFDSLTDCLNSSFSVDEEEFDPCSKRMRCSSPPLFPEVPIRLVSPDLFAVRASKPRRVSFSPQPPQAFYDPVITPDFSIEEDKVQS